MRRLNSEKAITVKVLNEVFESKLSVAGFNVKLSSMVSGSTVEVSAFISQSGFVTAITDTALHWLLVKPPVNSHFVKHADAAFQKSFEKWDKSKKTIIVNYEN